MNFNFRMLFWGTRKDSFKKKNIVLLLCFSLYTICMQAQAQTITGKVIDTKSEPLIGVSVSVQGTSNGTITDFDGLYSIAVQPGQQLTFSYIGMKTQTITVDSSNIINVTLEDDAQVLSDVVVIGYGSAKVERFNITNFYYSGRRSQQTSYQFTHAIVAGKGIWNANTEYGAAR